MYPFVLAVARRGDEALPGRIGAGGVGYNYRNSRTSFTLKACNLM
jgi:hypothetical protein